MRKILLLIFFSLSILLILSASAYSSEWIYISSLKGKDFYIDSESTRVEYTNVTFWGKEVSKNKEKLVEKITIDCKNEVFAIENIIDRSTSKIYTYFEDKLKWRGIPPDSVIEIYKRILCTNNQPRKDIKDYLKNLNRQSSN